MAPKLYYTPTSCGAASFIVAHALGLNIPCETVDLATHKTASGADYYAINPKVRSSPARVRCPRPAGRELTSHTCSTPIGERARPRAGRRHRAERGSCRPAVPGGPCACVSGLRVRSPCVEVGNRSASTSGAHDNQPTLPQKPEGGMAPEPKSTGRYLVQQGLNWVASELHAASGPLFAPGLSAEVKEFCVNRLKAKYKTLNDLLLKDKQFLAGDKFTVADRRVSLPPLQGPQVGLFGAAMRRADRIPWRARLSNSPSLQLLLHRHHVDRLLGHQPGRLSRREGLPGAVQGPPVRGERPRADGHVPGDDQRLMPRVQSESDTRQTPHLDNNQSPAIHTITKRRPGVAWPRC
jgi:glutathione S-transferase